MMTTWLGEGESRLPRFCTHFVGVGGFVVNYDREILVIKERYFYLSCLSVSLCFCVCVWIVDSL